MARKISRRSLAMYVATNLINQRRAVVVKQLAAYLVETRRTKELDMIVRDINFYLSEVGITSATLTSAYDLSAETKKAIEKFIVQKTKSSEVAIETRVDPNVLGGIKISLPGYELDQTIAHQLTVLKTRFKKA
jgi:F-type H+-transporting ATPase subunit delta